MTEKLPPYAYFDNGELTGLSVEVVQEVFKILSYPGKIEVLPWARAYRTTLQQENSVLFSVARTPQRENLFKWAGPIIADTIYFYKKRGIDLEVKTIDDARNADFVLVTRDSIEDIILQSKGFTNLYSTKDYAFALKMLANGRGDLLPTGELLLPVTLEDSNISPELIINTHVKLSKSELYIAFSKDIPDREVKLWQDAIDKLIVSGRMDEIKRKYILDIK